LYPYTTAPQSSHLLYTLLITPAAAYPQTSQLFFIYSEIQQRAYTLVF
jgi:hypothetical protein